MFDYISVSVSNKPVLVDCQVSEWSEFGQCSLECGGGKNSRSRQVILGRSVRASSDLLCQVLTRPANGGATCPTLEEEAPCNTQECALPANCEVGYLRSESQVELVGLAGE